jgi:hypothetical protein
VELEPLLSRAIIPAVGALAPVAEDVLLLPWVVTPCASTGVAIRPAAAVIKAVERSLLRAVMLDLLRCV